MPDRIRCPEDVCAILAALCRGRGAFALTPAEIERQINWRRRFLPDDKEAWSALMIRISCRASGEAERGLYLARGWTRRRYEAAWRRAAWAIVEGLASERINAAAIEANLAADERLEASGKVLPTRGAAPLYRRA